MELVPIVESPPPLHPCGHLVQAVAFVEGRFQQIVRLPCAECSTSNAWTVVEPSDPSRTFRANVDLTAKSPQLRLYQFVRVYRPSTMGVDDWFETLLKSSRIPSQYWRWN